MQSNRNIEKYTEDYIQDNFEKYQVEYRRKKVLEILKKYKPKNILEIGCGVDSISNYYTDFSKFTIVEPSIFFIQKAIKKEDKRIKIIHDFIENKIEILKEQEYDFILLSSLLHEVNKPDNLIQQVIKLCTKDTILHINVPNSKSLHLLWAYESGLIDRIGNLSKLAEKLQQHTTFDLDSLIKIVEIHNMKILESGSYFIKPFNHTKMQQCIDENLVDKKLLDGLYNLTKYMPELGSEIYVNCRKY